MTGTAGDNQEVSYLRRRADKAEKRLTKAVVAACPGEHEPVQHRDGFAPWCNICGRSARGVYMRDQSEDPQR